MKGVENLFVAVEKAAGRRLKKSDAEDRLLVQKGCFLLNRWGYGPEFVYDLYVDGPVSRELLRLFDNRSPGASDTDVPEDAICRLSALISRGPRYLDAYTSLLLAQDANPNASPELIMKLVIDFAPDLADSVEEASASLI